MNDNHRPGRARIHKCDRRRARSALLLFLTTALIGAVAPSVAAKIPVDPIDPDTGGGGGGTTPAYTDIDCDNIYIDWWQDVESDAKGMWNTAPGWSGCIAVTAQGIEEEGSYTVKSPYLTTGYNPSERDGRLDVVAAHGATFDGDGWRPMCRFLLAKYRDKLWRCFAPSLTGMGGGCYPGWNNEWPYGVELGDLPEIEFAGALDAAIAGIKAKDGLGLGEWILVGYSNGAGALSMLQDRLVDGGTNLRSKYGIDKILMMAPTPSHDVWWTFADDVDNHTDDPDYPYTPACDDDAESELTWELADTINDQLEVDLDAGTCADPEPSYDADEWVDTWWTEEGEEDDTGDPNDNITVTYDASRNGRLPTVDEAYDTANWMGWIAFNQMVGFWPHDRPSVAPDIWGGTTSTCSSTGQLCTRYASIAFDQDAYIYPVDVMHVHHWLTKSSPTCVNADGAYHDCTIVKGTHGGAFSLYATAWDNYVNSGYNTSKLTTQMDAVWNKLVVS